MLADEELSFELLEPDGLALEPDELEPDELEPGEPESDEPELDDVELDPDRLSFL